MAHSNRKRHPRVKSLNAGLKENPTFFTPIPGRHRWERPFDEKRPGTAWLRAWLWRVLWEYPEGLPVKTIERLAHSQGHQRRTLYTVWGELTKATGDIETVCRGKAGGGCIWRLSAIARAPWLAVPAAN